MRLLTDEQHAQIVELLQEPTYNRCKEALATLTAAPSVEHVGWHDTIDNADLTYSIGELMGGNNDGLDPLYAIKKETP